MNALKILVVDDEPGMRMSIARALRDFTVCLPDTEEELRFEIGEAACGEDALEMIAASAPDILFLDQKLPGLSGLEVLERIKDKHPGILTIMITAYASIDKVIRATKTGAYDFLAKPFTPAELRGALQKAAEHVTVTRRARQLEKERRQVRFLFISVLAHELKAPINAVEGYLGLIGDGALQCGTPAFDDAINRCSTRIQYMRKMIMDLLDLTRIESGEKVRKLSQVALVDAVAFAVETAELDARARGIEFHVDVPEDLVVHADPSEMGIIFNNLVSNAVKYNRDGGRVDVTAREEGDAAIIEVSDTGIGIAEEDAARLFQDFVRIKNSQTTNILGSGLGLSIVKKLARIYGGDVTVRSTPGVGTTFTVRLLKNAAVVEADEEAVCV